MSRVYDVATFLRRRRKILSEEELALLEGNVRKLAGWQFYAVAAVAVALAVWHMWLASVGVMSTMKIRYVHLGGTMVLAFLLYGATRKAARGRFHWHDGGFALLAIGLALYNLLEYETMVDRVGAGYLYDRVIGGAVVLLTIEMTRRVVGPAMPLLAAAAIVYAFVGPWMPSFLGHKGYDLGRIIDHVYMTTDGIYGLSLGVSASLVAIFMVFSAALQTSGAGNVFIQLANSLVGWSRGGPAKVAVVASGLFGSFSGSAAANVVGTGSITIPMMKKLGYQAHFAGAVEAVASTGGGIMPPVMAAAAFLIAEFLGIPYLDVVVAALLPAILYYLSIGFMVHITAVKTGLRGTPRNELPGFWATLRTGWALIAPIGVLFFLLAYERATPAKAAFWATIFLWGVYLLMAHRELLQNNGRAIFTKTLHALRIGGEQMVQVAAVTACAGILIGVFSLTGLGFRLSSALIELSGGSLPVLLALTMVAALIIGMGMPPTASYIILAIMVVPSLTKQGVQPLAAHLFVFYFANISNITPPVAIAAYAASGIANASAWTIGWTAFRLGAAAYIVPYMFVYGPQLLMIGEPVEIIAAIISSLLGCVALAAAVQAYYFGPMSWLQRLALFAAAVTLIKPGLITDAVGYVLFIGTLGYNWLKYSRLNKYNVNKLACADE